jgi:TolB-like protein
LALAHGQELLAHNFHWPELVGHVLIGVLIVGFPIAVALAWYHGHRGMTRISAGEMTVVSLLLVIGAGLLIALVRPSAERAPASASSAGVPKASVAVIPFANHTGDPSKEYFSDGMAEELINALAHVPGLNVPSRTSSFAYKGRNTDIRQIARDLNVATVLEGSVTSAGERIRVTAELVDAKSGYHLWSDSYERQFADIFKLQDELAAAIVQALRSTMGATISAPVSRAPPTQDVEAYQLYLQAQSVERGTEESAQQAIALFGQALERDPRFARAWAGRSIAWAIWAGGRHPPATALQDAERDARQALTLDPTLGEAHEALGLLSAVRRNWLEAETSFRAALAAGPGDPTIHAVFATAVLLPTGRLNQARSHLLEAYRLAPAGSLENAMLALIDSYLGLDAEAVKHANLAVGVGVPPDLRAITNARVAAHDGRYQEAGDQLAQALTAPMRDAGGAEVFKQAYLALADPKKKPAASRALAELVEKLGLNNIDPLWQPQFVLHFVMLDALDPAYDLANRLARSDSNGQNWRFLWVPDMRSFRKDPRFQELVMRLNFMDYWKRYGQPDGCDLAGERLVCR